MIQIINLVRKEKSNQNFSLKKEILLLEIYSPYKASEFSIDMVDDLASICNAKEIRFINQAEIMNIKLKF